MAVMTLVGVRPLLAWLLLCLPIERGLAGSRKKKEEDANKVAMPHHSFSIPLAYHDMLDHWTVSGSSIIETERLLLHPNVAERASFVFSKTPILTNDFEVTMAFRVIGDKDITKVIDDQMFALWYVFENVSASYNETKMIKAKSWNDGLKESGMTFAGFNSKFKGVGAVFSSMDASGNTKAVVSGIWNDGDRNIVHGAGKDVPTPTAKSIDYRNTLNAAQFRLRVSPTSIIGYLKQTPSLSWNECFNIDRSKDPVPSGGYLGFTAWSGTYSQVGKVDSVAITSLEAFNFNSSSQGEELTDVSIAIQEAYREMLTDDKRHFVDQKSQSEHIMRLHKMLEEHLNTTIPTDQKMYQDLQGLQDRMQKLDDGCKTLTKGLQVVASEKGADSGKDGLSNHIIGIRQLLTKELPSHREKLESLQRNVAEVRARNDGMRKSGLDIFSIAAEQTASLDATLTSRRSRNIWMFCGIVLLLLIVGYVMMTSMQNYEKKNFMDFGSHHEKRRLSF